LQCPNKNNLLISNQHNFTNCLLIDTPKKSINVCLITGIFPVITQIIPGDLKEAAIASMQARPAYFITEKR
jgi:hypothetical protein